ncbi:hypothetical protein BJG92_03118 [Arthrobacter sp. SO5]|uniref:hypothetical protein n=1 Tax=Arthrobacter sp. SO5 TaxID=1897055 RepID=UPI001E48D6E1|nr:hypothetical protein [Arthrobacter sp. SO5]MCB5275567.1 hypothetical protein [Arthrobacter sp. SO5]
MGLLKRWLKGRHKRRHLNLDSCTDCLLQQRRQRQYLARLRDAEIPRASEDLTARLLARTAELASEPPTGPRLTPNTAPHRALRLSVLTAGGVAAAVTLMAGSAYLMGRETPPMASGAGSPAFVQQDRPVGDAGLDTPGGADASGWSLTGTAHAPAGALTAAQLSGLRAQGWTCPELRELDYHLVWARGGVVAGEKLLELRLTDGRHFVTVLEQHLPGSTPPVNALTGHSAAADGFSPETLQGIGLPAAPTGGPSAAGEGSLWINAAAPFRAIYQTPSATFTFVSDQSAEQADDGVAALVRSRAGSPAGTPKNGTGGTGSGEGGADVVIERMERGLGRILELLAP